MLGEVNEVFLVVVVVVKVVGVGGVVGIVEGGVGTVVLGWGQGQGLWALCVLPDVMMALLQKW